MAMRVNLKRLLIATGAMMVGLVFCALAALPWGLVALVAPFALERELFGTSTLYNLPSPLPILVLILFYLIPIGSLLLPFFSENKPRALMWAGAGGILLPVTFFALVGARVTLDSRWPAEEPAAAARLISTEALIEPGASIGSMAWSPNGKFISIAGSQRDETDAIALVNVDTGQTQVRIYDAFHAFWDAGNRLWVLGENTWRVYREPFETVERVPLGYAGPEPLADHDVWDFEPNARLLAVAEAGEERATWRLRLWRDGQFAYEIPLAPHNRGEYGDYQVARGLGLSFSPGGAYLALATSGSTPDGEAVADELWLLDVAGRRLQFLKEGKTNSWLIWNYDVQDLDPVWAADGEALYFGDATFGVERLDVPSGRAARVLGWNTGVFEIGLSSSGEWMAFERGSRYSRDQTGCASHVGALSLHRGFVTFVPAAWKECPCVSFAWHPGRDVLAILARHDCRDYNLFLWDPSAVQE
jgi:hypothetical protein